MTKKPNETLLDLVFGVIIYGIMLEVIGLLVVENPLSYSLGLFLGCGVAIFLSIRMYVTLDEALDMDEKSATRYITKQGIFRAVVMLVAAAIGMVVPFISFIAVIIGILGLKIAAYLHGVTNQYITKFLFTKGR